MKQRSRLRTSLRHRHWSWTRLEKQSPAHSEAEACARFETRSKTQSKPESGLSDGSKGITNLDVHFLFHKQELKPGISRSLEPGSASPAVDITAKTHAEEGDLEEREGEACRSILPLRPYLCQSHLFLRQGPRQSRYHYPRLGHIQAISICV